MLNIGNIVHVCVQREGEPSRGNQTGWAGNHWTGAKSSEHPGTLLTIHSRISIVAMKLVHTIIVCQKVIAPRGFH